MGFGGLRASQRCSHQWRSRRIFQDFNQFTKRGSRVHQFLNREGSWLPLVAKASIIDLDNKNFDTDVKDKASICVPAIGKVTIVMLLRNLLVSRRLSVIAASELNHAATRPKQRGKYGQ